VIALFTAAFAGPSHFELRQAVRKRDVTAVTALLDAGVPPNGVGDVEDRPLTLAARNALTRDDGLVALLLARGADPNVTGHREGPVLEYVVRALDRPRGEAVARQLLAAGADPVHEGRTVLGWYRGDHPERAVQLGLDAGVPLDRLVCDAPDAEVLADLLARGAPPDASCDGTPPLLRAIDAVDGPRVDVLLAAGVDPSAPGMLGHRPVTPLHVAAHRDWSWGVERFLALDVDRDATVSPVGLEPLRMARGAARIRLVEAGARRSRPYADPAIWTARALDPVEVPSYLAAVVEHQEVPAVEAWEEALSADGREWLTRHWATLSSAPTLAGVTPDDLIRARRFQPTADCLDVPAPTLADLKATVGAPLSRARDGVLRTWTFADDVSARGWHRGFRSRVIEVDGLCGDGAETLLGVHRAAVWAALGDRPVWVEPARDRWALPGPLLTYADDRLVGVGHAFRGR
jgi:hypothetical protein